MTTVTSDRENDIFWHITFYVIFFFLKKKVYLFFRERRREGETKGEKHPSVASHTPPTGALTGDLIDELLVHRLLFNPLSYTCQGVCGTL